MCLQWYGVGISRACVLHSPADMDPCQKDGGIPHRFDSASLPRPFARASWPIRIRLAMERNTARSTKGGARQSTARPIVCLRGDWRARRDDGYIVPVLSGDTGYVPIPLEAHHRTRTRTTWVDRVLPWCGTAGWPLRSGMVPDQAKAAHGQGRASAAHLAIGPGADSRVP